MAETEEEQWREIPGFDGQYEVSNRGRIRSWKKWARASEPPPRIMRQSANGVIQLGLHGGKHKVSDLFYRVWPDGIPF